MNAADGRDDRALVVGPLAMPARAAATTRPPAGAAEPTSAAPEPDQPKTT